MDHRLEKALDFSNYLKTFYKQRELLLEQFKEKTVHYCNGGKFTITLELITYCSQFQKTNDSIVLLDDNSLPIKIDNIDKFHNQIFQIYQEASTEYYNAYELLKKERTTESLIEHD